MNRNDKPAGVKRNPGNPGTPDNLSPRSAERRGRTDKRLGVPRTNPGQTPDTSSADLRLGSAPASASKARRGTVASGNGGTARPPLHLVKGRPARQGAAQSEPPARPPTRPATHRRLKTSMPCGATKSGEDVAACLEGYRENLAHLAELMELASARLRLALCEPAAA